MADEPHTEQLQKTLERLGGKEDGPRSERDVVLSRLWSPPATEAIGITEIVG